VTDVASVMDRKLWTLSVCVLSGVHLPSIRTW
jgi:hypothetical protein